LESALGIGATFQTTNQQLANQPSVARHFASVNPNGRNSSPIIVLKPRLQLAERLAAEEPSPVVLAEKERGNITGNSITEARRTRLSMEAESVDQR
jgi:hypothetical protein